MAAPLKVLFVASECAPFAKTGGLADVVGALPIALRRHGVDVRIVMPLYAGMPWTEFEVLDGSLVVPMYWGQASARVRVGKLPRSDVPIYCLEYNRYFDRPYLYGPPSQGYSDNLERFTFLSRGALEICKALGFIPDVIHCNDWQTALVPVYLNTFEWAQPLHGTASIYSIHNLAYQGVLESGALFITGLGREHYNPGEFEHFGALNLTKAALYHSTLLSTVSPTYAREIQTGAYGCGLDGVLASRSRDLRGILNGIDVDEWNPATDPFIPAHVRRAPHGRQGEVQGGAAKGSRPAGARRRADLRPGRTPDHAKGRRRARARAGAHPALGRAAGPARHRRSRGRGVLRALRTSAAIAFAPGSASTTGAPTASRPAATSS